jgi:hypothetical protein
MTDRKLGKTATGVPITDDLIAKLAAEAEAGYDVEEILSRRRGRPTIGASAAGVESVRLEPELRSAVRDRAERDAMTVSSVIREALRLYLAAEVGPSNAAWSSLRPLKLRSPDAALGMISPGRSLPNLHVKLEAPASSRHKSSSRRLAATSCHLVVSSGPGALGADVDQARVRQSVDTWKTTMKLGA